MSPIYLYNGKILINDNKIATNPNCCCGCTCENFPLVASPANIVVPDENAECGWSYENVYILSDNDCCQTLDVSYRFKMFNDGPWIEYTDTIPFGWDPNGDANEQFPFDWNGWIVNQECSDGIIDVTLTSLHIGTGPTPILTGTIVLNQNQGCCALDGSVTLTLSWSEGDITGQQFEFISATITSGSRILTEPATGMDYYLCTEAIQTCTTAGCQFLVGTKDGVTSYKPLAPIISSWVLNKGTQEIFIAYNGVPIPASGLDPYGETIPLTSQTLYPGPGLCAFPVPTGTPPECCPAGYDICITDYQFFENGSDAFEMYSAGYYFTSDYFIPSKNPANFDIDNIILDVSSPSKTWELSSSDSCMCVCTKEDGTATFEICDDCDGRADDLSSLSGVAVSWPGGKGTCCLPNDGGSDILNKTACDEAGGTWHLDLNYDCTNPLP